MVRLYKSVPVDTSGRTQTNVQASVGFDDPILVHDSFEKSPLLWTASGTGADYSVLRSPESAYYGSFGCNLKTKATGPAANDYVNITRDYAISGKDVIDLRTLFRIVNPGGQIKEFTLTAAHQLSNLLETFSVKYTGTSGNLYYLNSSGFYANVLVGKLLCGNHWHRLSVKASTSTRKYKSLTVDSVSVDLTDIAIRTVANPGADDSFNVSLNVVTAGANQAEVDIDNIIVQYSADGV